MDKIGIKDLEENYTITLEPASQLKFTSENQTDQSLIDSPKDLILKISSRNQQSTDSLTFKVSYVRKNGKEIWNIDYAPSSSALTSRDYFISFRAGVINGNPHYVRASALMEMQSILSLMTKKMNSPQQTEYLLRLNLLLRLTASHPEKNQAVLKAWQSFKQTLKDKDLTEYKLTQNDLEVISDLRKLKDANNVTVGEPNIANIEKFLSSKSKEFLKLDDGLGSSITAEKAENGALVLNLTFLTKKVTTEQISLWLKPYILTGKSEITITDIPGFKWLANYSVKIDISSLEESLKKSTLYTFFNELSSSSFAIGVRAKKSLKADSGPTYDKFVQAIKNTISTYLAKRSVNENDLTIEEKIELVKYGHLSYYKLVIPTLSPEQRAGGVQYKAALSAREIIIYIKEVFPNTTDTELQPLIKQAAKDVTDYLSNTFKDF
ncbi:MAG: hypothetical protein AABY64_13840 [Bdellovibrionota bacterium]